MKLVRESLNEISVGKKSGLGALGIGKSNMIRKWLDEKHVTNYKINDDSTIDVRGDVILESEVDGALPDFIQFRIVTGDFNIQANNLLHLKGCPYTVGKDFVCSLNELGSLDFCPKTVGKDFLIFDNKYKDFSEKEIRNRCSIGGRVYIDENEWLDASYVINPDDAPSAHTKYFKR